MSSAVFPTLTGLGWDVVRTPMWDTTIQQNVSGKEVRMSNYTYPRHQWDLTFDGLRQGTINSVVFGEFATLFGFYNQRQGSFDSFLYADADDNTVAAQTVATGDGTTKAFQLVRAFGGFVEPVLAPNVVTQVYDNGTPVAAVAAPTNGTLTSTTAGALAATTYYVKTTWLTGTGETVASAETSLVVAINKVLNVAAPGSAPSGATGWNVYVSNTAGGGAGAETRQNGNTPVALATPWVEPNSGLIAGVAAPATDQSSAWNVNAWGTTSPGLLNFNVAPTNGHAITADFSYYWPCRFVDDTIPFTKFISNMYSGKKVSFISLKN